MSERSTPYTLLGWATVTAITVSPPAMAQDDRPTTLPGIEIIGSPEAEETLPGSATYLDTDDIRNQSYDDINRVLRQSPGVYIREEDGSGLFPNISIRGVDHGRSAKVMLLEDGIPQEPAPYSAPSAYFSPTTGRMSGIEVLKGSSQVRHGPHVTGGVVNYLSTSIPSEQSGYFKQVAGEDGELRSHIYFGDSLDTAGGRVGYLLEGFFRRNDGFKNIDRTADFRDNDDTGLTNDDFNVKLSWEPNSQRYQRFELSAGRTELDANETYLGLTEDDFDNDSFRRYAASRFDNIETLQERIVLRHFIELSDSTELSTAIYNNEFERDWYKLNEVSSTTDPDDGESLSTAIGEGDDALDVLRGNAAGNLNVRSNAREYYSRGIQSQLTHRFATGAVDHEVTAGLRFHADEIDRFQFEDNFTQEANGTISDRTRTEPGAAGDRIQETEAVALNVDDRITMGRLTLTPGIRAEWLNQEFEEDQRTSAAGAEPDGGSDDLTMVGGGIGAIWQQDRNWTFSGGVFRGFSPPSPKANISGDIEEETSISTELGVTYTSDSGAFRTTATAFRTDFDDLVVPDNVGATGGGNEETSSVGEVTTQGLELSAQWDPGMARGWALNTPLTLSATFTDAEIANASTSNDAESIFSGGENGNDVPYIPDTQFTATIGVEGANWGSELVGTYVGEVFATASNNSGQVDQDGNPDARFGKIDSYFIADISVYYELQNNLRVSAGVHNLFDKEYTASRLPHAARPGKPQTGYVSAELEF